MTFHYGIDVSMCVYVCGVRAHECFLADGYAYRWTVVSHLVMHWLKKYLLKDWPKLWAIGLLDQLEVNEKSILKLLFSNVFFLFGESTLSPNVFIASN